MEKNLTIMSGVDRLDEQFLGYINKVSRFFLLKINPEPQKTTYPIVPSRCEYNRTDRAPRCGRWVVNPSLKILESDTTMSGVEKTSDEFISATVPIKSSESEEQSSRDSEKHENYKFYCKNTSKNLANIISEIESDGGVWESLKQSEIFFHNGNKFSECSERFLVSDRSYQQVTYQVTNGDRRGAVEYSETDSLIPDTYNINDRIIPSYYINNDGIKVGPLRFNFYDTIIDSIRNFRILSSYQLTYIEKCSQEEKKIHHSQ